MKDLTNTDETRETRIVDEIVVDAYDEVERALGWYYYLDEKITFPFKAKCIREMKISPLTLDEKVEVTGMPSEEDCESRMLVLVKWKNRTFGVPLEQLEPLQTDEETMEAIEDWHYWTAQNYQF